jgi:SSS family solute:Na+ symporter
MLDIIIISSYLIISLIIGIYNRSTSSTLSGYSHLGKDINNNSMILAATIFASAVGGGTTFGISEKAFSGNLAFTFGLLLTIPIDILIAIYIVPKLSHYKDSNSIGEIVGKHYGISPRVITGIAVTLISIGYLSVQISVSGRIFSYLFGLDYIDAVIASYAIVILYTTIGGLRSVVVNNSIQFIAMIIAIPTLTILGISEIGLENFKANIPAENYNFFSSDNLLTNTIYTTLSFSVMGFYPTFIQRVLAGRNSPSVQKAIYLKSVIYVFFIICLTLNGLIASQLVPDSLPINSLTDLIDKIIPTGFRAIVLIGFLAAVMSTADSDLNVASISIVNDILQPMKIAREKNLLVITKLLTVIVGSSVILIVIGFQGIVELIIFSAGLWAPTAAVPLIGLLLNRKTSDKGFIISALIGSFVFLSTNLILSSNTISPIFIGTFASAIVFISISKKFES